MLIPLTEILQNTGINIRGAIHVGGHYGQEANMYFDHNIKEAHFFEPQQKPFECLKIKCDSLGYHCYNVALGSTEQMLEMHVEEDNEGQSSSLLEPHLHLKEYPNISFTKKIQIPVKILDNYNIRNCNFLNIDVQGYELEVLKGSVKTLNSIDIIYSEVNRAELYKNCPLIQDITIFLNQYNFVLQKTVWYEGCRDWGEAIFIKYK
jgi:FkbM family methyltransferase